MRKKHHPGIIFGVLTFGLLVAGCNRDKSASGDQKAANPSGYFQTAFYEESQFIVETIASDVAEQLFYAKHHRLPDPKEFHVRATETAGSKPGAPVYEIEIALDSKQPAFHHTLSITNAIWSADVYRGMTADLAAKIGLDTVSTSDGEDTTLLTALTDARADTLEKENQKLSLALETDFANPLFHEKAGLLLGAFALRERSGDFLEIRSPLCRITAHLAVARQLRAEKPASNNARIADIMLETLMNNQAVAVSKLSKLAADETTVKWARTLRAYNTADYRPLQELPKLSPIERVALFYAFAASVDTDMAWQELSAGEKLSPAFARIANSEGYSVETGHDLLRMSLPSEMRECATVFQLSSGQKPEQKEMIGALNEEPGRCFKSDGRVRVIGWGLWAGFFQRQLCHAVQNNFDFMQNKWGVPDDAREYSAKCDEMFGGLRLYPFVRRFNCTETAGYHKAVDDTLAVTVKTPHLVPAQCWNYVCYRPSFASERYLPSANPHINEWHKHNPPPGTAYNPQPRLDHPSLINGPGSAERITRLHEMAPYDSSISYYIFRVRYNKAPTYEQAETLYQDVLPYATYAMNKVADTMLAQPVQYEKLMSEAARLDPFRYFTLAEYFQNRQQEEKAATYYEKAFEKSTDAVLSANKAGWLVKYYLKKGEIEKARKLADEAGETYSYAGLETKGDFLEVTKKYNEAFEYYSRIQQRYNQSGPLIAFCSRYKTLTGDSRFDSVLKNLTAGLFPKGQEKVELKSFSVAPGDGVLVEEENDLVRKAGMKRGDVIVAIYGIRVHDFPQYSAAREFSSNPEIVLIVWQGDQYREIKFPLPGHRFGVQFNTYRPH